jgi:hypothetical protein
MVHQVDGSAEHTCEHKLARSCQAPWNGSNGTWMLKLLSLVW